MQKYIQLKGFVKSNNEAVEAVVQYLAEKYKIEKEEVKKYVDGATVNPDETYDFLDKVYALTKLTTPRGKPAGVPMIAFYQHPYTTRALG